MEECCCNKPIHNPKGGSLPTDTYARTHTYTFMTFRWSDLGRKSQTVNFYLSLSLSLSLLFHTCRERPQATTSESAARCVRCLVRTHTLTTHTQREAACCSNVPSGFRNDSVVCYTTLPCLPSVPQASEISHRQRGGRLLSSVEGIRMHIHPYLSHVCLCACDGWGSHESTDG